ncbi:lysozyme [Methylobacterium brachythecii]|uniref:Lysozyme n=1 Tax=Methylobacterium brachythecii TaxID=1176177 RepID=A0A7W6ACK2_9HYPH|nr:lysozyme [Methylobacterium brachythecii]MBB3900760.1 lysozyme [Methylobacterium brachythecii]GLS46429.1 hypothetical protein GCM10007884_44230 [Methylobacterium brachythecii]
MTASAIMTPLGIAVLKAREGVRLKAYRDSVGVPTIGYGHTRGVRLGQSITQGQADALFLEDLAGHALPILSCVTVPVEDHERDALISIAFNIGVAGFRNSTFLRRLNTGDRAGAAEAILAWRKPPEILSRRQAETDQFRTPYASAPPKARRSDPRPVALPTAFDPARPLPVSPPGMFGRLWQQLRDRLPG